MRVIFRSWLLRRTRSFVHQISAHKINIMTIEIPDSLLENSSIDGRIFRTDLAIFLFEKEIFTLSQAAEFASMYQFEMQKLLAIRNIPMHYNVDEFLEDVQTLESLSENDNRK